MVKVITHPVQMDSSSILECAAVFRSGDYDIVSTVPTEENTPHNLSKVLRDKTSYRIILDDPEADYSYFSMVYSNPNGEKILMPLGVYGISNKKNAMFPLAVYGLWFNLLTLSKQSFCQSLSITDEGDFQFKKFLEWKKEFITKIFSFYSKITSHSPVMSWKLKGEKSNTRVIAESLGFQRVVFNNNELYSKEKIDEGSDLLKYFKNCLFRWDVIGRDELRQGQQMEENIVKLISNIVVLSQGEEVSL